ncbi:hypothetical protein AB3S75_018487 [Citrus x aurantiifolia]
MSQRQKYLLPSQGFFKQVDTKLERFVLTINTFTSSQQKTLAATRGFVLESEQTDIEQYMGRRNSNSMRLRCYELAFSIVIFIIIYLITVSAQPVSLPSQIKKGARGAGARGGARGGGFAVTRNGHHRSSSSPNPAAHNNNYFHLASFLFFCFFLI